MTEILMRFSYLVADYPEIKELDVNPLLVTPEDVVALDARVVLDSELATHTILPFAHLAIRPYPEEYVTQRKLKDETSVVLRLGNMAVMRFQIHLAPSPRTMICCADSAPRFTAIR